MDSDWQRTFRERMRRFESGHGQRRGGVAVSIELRVTSGCFHREHSPQPYRLIDGYLGKLSPAAGDFAFEEHESGPELLVCLAVITAGATLTKSIIDLVATIIKARAEGIRKGDQPSDPLELIVRDIRDGHDFREEMTLRIGHADHMSDEIIEKKIDEALGRLLKKEDTEEGSG